MKAITAAMMAMAAEPKNMNHLPCLMAKPKVGGPMATPKKRTVPYRQVMVPLRSVLVAPVIKELMGGSKIPMLIPEKNSTVI